VPLAEVPSDNWRKVVDVDLSSVFYCLKAGLPVMVKQGGGAIVNTASAAGLIGGFNLSVYTAAKHAAIGLIKTAAMDYATQRCGGAIDTPFIAQLPKPFPDRLVFGTPMTRPGTAEEMAHAVLWLCSDAATYVTGHALATGGGTVLGGIMHALRGPDRKAMNAHILVLGSVTDRLMGPQTARASASLEQVPADGAVAAASVSRLECPTHRCLAPSTARSYRGQRSRPRYRPQRDHTPGNPTRSRGGRRVERHRGPKSDGHGEGGDTRRDEPAQQPAIDLRRDRHAECDDAQV
jgi:hypothetical protein